MLQHEASMHVQNSAQYEHPTVLQTIDVWILQLILAQNHDHVTEIVSVMG